MKNEDQSIERGLCEAESLKEKVERLAKAYDSEQLFRLAQFQAVRTIGNMIEAGEYFMALREREDRSFKKFFVGKSITYQSALYSIKCAEVAHRHPKFKNLKSSRAFRQLLSMTIPNQDAIAESLADAPLGEIDHMLKGEIERLHQEANENDDDAPVRKPQVGGRGPGDPLGLLQRWTKEIFDRLEKIFFLELAMIDETTRESIRVELWNRTDATCAKLRDPDCNPLDRSFEIEPDDGSPVDCPEYDISHLKARAVRPVPLSKK